MSFPVLGPPPFFEFEGAEALLQVTVSDANAVTVEQQLRVLLTFDRLDDLPETVDVAPPT